MADSTINGLTALTGANVDNTADQLAIWDNSATTTKKITRQQLMIGLPAGTASAPAISFSGDADTGIWSPAGNAFAISTNGVESIRINSSGNTGIGVDPSARLHVYGDTYPNSQLRIQRNGAVNGTYSIGIAGSNNTLYIQDEVNSSARIVIDGSGNLGIGVTSPLNHVSLPNNKFIAWKSSTGGSESIGVAANSSDAFVFYNVSERLRIKSTGQIRFVPIAADPSGAESGDVYYNSSTNKLRCYNGTSWNDLF